MSDVLESLYLKLPKNHLEMIQKSNSISKFKMILELLKIPCNIWICDNNSRSGYHLFQMLQFVTGYENLKVEFKIYVENEPKRLDGSSINDVTYVTIDGFEMNNRVCSSWKNIGKPIVKVLTHDKEFIKEIQII